MVTETLFDMATLFADIDAARMPETARLLLLDRAAKGMRIQMADVLCGGFAQGSPSEAVSEIEADVVQAMVQFIADRPLQVGGPLRFLLDQVHQRPGAADIAS